MCFKCFLRTVSAKSSKVQVLGILSLSSSKFFLSYLSHSICFKLLPWISWTKCSELFCKQIQSMIPGLRALRRYVSLIFPKLTFYVYASEDLSKRCAAQLLTNLSLVCAITKFTRALGQKKTG